MKVREIACAVMIILAAGVGMAEDTAPQPQEIIENMIDAAGGREAFKQLGVLQLRLNEEETTSDGTIHKSAVKAWVSTTALDTFRLEMPNRNLTMARNIDHGWAVYRGQLDRRPSTPAMAKGTIHGRLFPVLLPYALAMKEVRVLDVREGKFDRQAAWMLRVSFADDFFSSPVMNSVWNIFVAKKDYSFLAASFQPPKNLAKAETEGIRYRYLKHQSIGTVRLPSQVLMEGLFTSGLENGHSRIINVSAEVSDWDAALFLDPEQLKKLEQQDNAGFDS